jgi:hypothetical protein
MAATTPISSNPKVLPHNVIAFQRSGETIAESYEKAVADR